MQMAVGIDFSQAQLTGEHVAAYAGAGGNPATAVVTVFGGRPARPAPYEFDIGRREVICFQVRTAAAAAAAAAAARSRSGPRPAAARGIRPRLALSPARPRRLCRTTPPGPMTAPPPALPARALSARPAGETVLGRRAARWPIAWPRVRDPGPIPGPFDAGRPRCRLRSESADPWEGRAGGWGASGQAWRAPCLLVGGRV